MYPCYFDIKSATTDEITAFHHDSDLLGMIYDLDNWYITDAWAEKFRQHVQKILPQAEAGNPLAEYIIGVIYLYGFCYSKQEDYEKNLEYDTLEAIKWLIRSARQGMVVAIDNLLASGDGAIPEVQRLRKICNEIEIEIKQGKVFEPGETWRRAYNLSNQAL